MNNLIVQAIGAVRQLSEYVNVEIEKERVKKTVGSSMDCMVILNPANTLGGNFLRVALIFIKSSSYLEVDDICSYLRVSQVHVKGELTDLENIGTNFTTNDVEIVIKPLTTDPDYVKCPRCSRYTHEGLDSVDAICNTCYPVLNQN
jgi:hypothetical protein